MKLALLLDGSYEDTRADLIVQLDAAIRGDDKRTIRSIMGSLLMLSLKEGD